MPWNLPDGKKPSFEKKADGGKKNESAVQRASSWLSLLNCFEDGRFRPLRFSMILAVVLLLAQLAHEKLQPRRESPVAAKSLWDQLSGDQPTGDKPQ